MAEYCYGKFEEYYILAYIFTIENRSIDSPISDRVIIPTVEGFGVKKAPSSAIIREIDPAVMLRY